MQELGLKNIFDKIDSYENFAFPSMAFVHVYA